MKNITFFDTMKCVVNQNCSSANEAKTELQLVEAKEVNRKQNQESKLDFQLFDIDEVFAN